MGLKRLRNLLVAALLGVGLIGVGEAYAQQGTVTGRVVDQQTGRPLSGVAVTVSGTNRGGMTNAEGRYLIVGVPAGQHELRVALIGYSSASATVTVTAGETTTQDFALSVSAIALEGVVVNAATGREQRTRELGTKVANIDLTQMNMGPVTSLADAIGGRSEGVIMQDVNGTTGTSQRIRIRGANSISLSNEPLIFIDGIQANTAMSGFGVGGQQPTRLGDLNPNDIESIEILKGPAASALYGTAAANGVMLIRTKRGRPGQTMWTAYIETGRIDDITDWPANYGSYEILDPTLPLYNDDGRANTAAIRFCSNINAAAGLCKQDAMMSFNTLKDSRTAFHSTGSRQRYGLSVQGGNEDVRYFLSGQFEDETGVIAFNTLQKINVRANVDARVNDKTDVGVSFGYTDSNLVLNSNDNSVLSPIINGLSGLPYYIKELPDQPGVVNRANYGYGYNMNMLEQLATYQDVDRYTAAANLRYRPTSWLTANVSGGLDMTVTHDFETLQPGHISLSDEYWGGYRASYRENSYIYTFTASAVGTFELTSSLVSNTTIGTQYNRDHSMGTYCYGAMMIPGTGSCGTVSDYFDIDEEFYEVKTAAVYAQQEFAWRDRVFLAGSLRADDNSAFGRDFDLAWYPSVSASWVIGEEEWFPKTSIVNELRLRSAWGSSGLRPGFRSAQTIYSPVTVADGGSDVPGVSLSVTGNPELKPETSTELEFGFEASMFDSRLGIDFTYFNKKSKDALISRPLAPSAGLTATYLDNIGSLRNKGTELSARLQVLETDKVGLSLSFTNTTLDNKILDMGGEKISFNRGLQQHREGYPAGGFWQPKVTWNDADGDGKIDYFDTNGDGVISGNESEVQVGDTAVYIGPALPTWTRTVSANLRLFNWINVSTLFEGRGGHYTGNDSEAFRCGLRVNQQMGCAAVADMNASLEDQARFIADRYLGSAYGYVEKADFWRWRELAVSLTAPNALIERVPQLRGMRLTVSGRNLALFTDYTGLDPETVEGGGAANFSQSEFNTQPPVRYWMIRLDYNF